MSISSHRDRQITTSAGIAIILFISILTTAILLSTAPLSAQDTAGAGKIPLPASFTSETPVPPPVNSTGKKPAPFPAPAEWVDMANVDAVQFQPNIRIPAADMDFPQQANGSAGKGYLGAAQSPGMPLAAASASPTVLDWTVIISDSFSAEWPGAWDIYDLSDDGYYRGWGFIDLYATGDYWAWPANGGTDGIDPNLGYPDNMKTWMIQGPFDLSTSSDVFTSFNLWYDTEYGYDYVYFCVGLDTILGDGDWKCNHWSGYSDGWTKQTYWLTSYAGYTEVYFGWYFTSDESISGIDEYYGPYIDNIEVWINEGVPTLPTATPDPAGQLIANHSFESGDLTAWSSCTGPSCDSPADSSVEQRPSLETGAAADSVNQPLANGTILSTGVVTGTSAGGDYAAILSRSGGAAIDWLYQKFTIPPDVTDMVVDFWFTSASEETETEKDSFCASLRSYTGTEWSIIVDLGCLDATKAAGNWEQVVYALTADELSRAKLPAEVALVFELANGGAEGSGTTVWVDLAAVYAIGGSGGSYSDANEPNDDFSTATEIGCGDTISGIVGETNRDQDQDLFLLSSVAPGVIDISVAADIQRPSSDLDSMIFFYDASKPASAPPLASNDDNGATLDSSLTYTNAIAGANYIIKVSSYSGFGNLNSFYDLTVECAGISKGVLSTKSDSADPPPDSWTIMLYLNAEDEESAQMLTLYRQDIERFISGKADFLTVVILYDGPGAGDTVRYLVQPNGRYKPGISLWKQGEINMGSPDSLATFVGWAMDQHSAENYYLAIDAHGDGAYGIGADPTSGSDSLTSTDIYSALKSATHHGEASRRIDILDFESCLMGLAENAYDVRQWVDYVIFSQQMSWGFKTYPRYFADLTATDPPLVVGQRIINRYHSALIHDQDNIYPHTISLIDTAKLGSVEQAVTDLANALISSGAQSMITSARDNSQSFSNDPDATNPAKAEYIDLWDLAAALSSVAPTQASAVRNTIDAAVIVEEHASGDADGHSWDHSGVHGLSIYFPTTRSSNAFSSYPTRYQMSREGGWDEFLKWFYPDEEDVRHGLPVLLAEHRPAIDYYVGEHRVFLPTILRQ